MTSSNLLMRLRAATSDLHDRVETLSDVEASLRDRARRPDAVRRLYSFHAAIDGSVAPWGEAMLAVGYAPEPRSPLIAAEWPDEGLAAAPMAPAADLGSALGMVYVTDGSMLGGRIMRRGMTRDGIGLDGLAFLDPHGDETGARFQSLIAAMETAVESGRADQDRIVEGAVMAFGVALDRLVERVPEAAA